MNQEVIIIKEYCVQSRIESDFIMRLADEGLIDVYIAAEEPYLYISQLSKVERYARLYYDLSVNIEGIDIIQNLWDKIDDMQSEINKLRQTIRLLDIRE